MHIPSFLAGLGAMAVIWVIVTVIRHLIRDDSQSQPVLAPEPDEYRPGPAVDFGPVPEEARTPDEGGAEDPADDDSTGDEGGEEEGDRPYFKISLLSERGPMVTWDNVKEILQTDPEHIEFSVVGEGKDDDTHDLFPGRYAVYIEPIREQK